MKKIISLAWDQELIARIISRSSAEYVWAPVLLSLGLLKSRLMTSKLTILGPIIFLQVGLPALAFLYLFRKGHISDIDLTERDERYRLYGFSLACSVLATVGAKIWTNPYFFQLELVFTLTTAVFLLITFFWKISGHTLLNTMGVFLVNFWFDQSLVALYLLIPLVFWSRYVLEKHTLAQLAAGVLLGMTVFWFYSLII